MSETPSILRRLGQAAERKEAAEGTLPDFTNKLGMCGRLAITPGELGQLTNGAIDPIGNITIGLGQAAANAREKAKEAIMNLKSISGLFSKHRLGLLMPEVLIEEMEKEKQKKPMPDTIIQVWK